MQVYKKKHRDTQKEKRMNKIIERSKQRRNGFMDERKKQTNTKMQKLKGKIILSIK